MSSNPTSRFFLGCLIKGPIGCFAFFVGATVVGVFFLPHTGGRQVADWLERVFDESLAGSLELNDAWLLSLYGPQDGRVLLRDPDGREVLRGTFGAPSLAEALDEDGHYGPLSLHIDYCEIVTGSDGVTNLRRALSPRVDGKDVTISLDTAQTERVDFQLTIEHLVWRDEYGDTTFELRSFLGDATARLENGIGAIEFKGNGTVVGEEVGKLETRVFVPDIMAFLLDRGGTGQFEVRLQHMDSRELDLITGQGDAFTSGFGPRTDRFALVADRLRDRSVHLTLDVESPLAELSLTGQLDRANHRLVARDGDRLQASFAMDSGLADHVVKRLLPVWSEVESADPEGIFAIESTHFALPLHHDPSALDGVFSLELAPLAYVLDERLHAQLPHEALARLHNTRAAHVILGVDQGVVRYDDIAIPLEVGTLGVEGGYDLGSGEANFIVRLPSDLGGEVAATYAVPGPRGLADAPVTPTAPAAPEPTIPDPVTPEPTPDSGPPR